MSKILNIDKLAEEMFEPIVLTLDGKVYTIKSLPNDVIGELSHVKDSKRDLADVIAKLVDVDPKVFKKTDIRKLGIFTKAITEVFTEEIQAFASKNVFGEK